MKKLFYLCILFSILLVTYANSAKLKKQDDQVPAQQPPSDADPKQQAAQQGQSLDLGSDLSIQQGSSDSLNIAPSQDPEQIPSSDALNIAPEDGQATQQIPGNSAPQEGQPTEQIPATPNPYDVPEKDRSQEYHTTLDDALAFDPTTLIDPQCAPDSAFNAKIVEMNTWIIILENPQRLEGDVSALKKVRELILKARESDDAIQATPFSFIQISMSSQATMNTQYVQILYEKQFKSIYSKMSQLQSKVVADKQGLIEDIIYDIDHLIEQLDQVLTRKDNFPEYIQTLKDKVVQIYKLQDACAGPTPQSVSIKKPEPEVIETPVQSANIEPAEKYPSSGNLELIQKEPKKLRKNSK